jgi:hypothetical protein
VRRIVSPNALECADSSALCGALDLSTRRGAGRGGKQPPPQSGDKSPQSKWRILAAVALGLAWVTAPAKATDPDTFSPVVSYQFHESLADGSTAPNIFSPVVSYQYYDWIGDENVTFQTSPNVSYFFSGGVVLGFTGSVRDTLGAPVAGAVVTLKWFGAVIWTGITDANGAFSAPGLPAANYIITVAKPGFQTLLTNAAGFNGGAGTLAITLAGAPAALAAQAISRIPIALALGTADAPDPGDIDAPVFKVFDGTNFVPWHPANPPAGVTLYPSRMTVVLSHGMLSSIDGNGAWALPLARLIRDHHNLGSRPNIVAWDWRRPAARIANQNTIGPPIDAAHDQGEFLGRTLHEVLGPGYSQRLHFIGHSLGTIVNRVACDYVHGKLPESPDRVSPNVANPWSLQSTRPHVTLMDEAEVASVFGQNVATAAQIGAAVAGLKGAVVAGVPAAIANWKSPIPTGADWVDNYISMVGVQRSECVNVCLLAPAFSFASPVAAHSYAHEWYRWSVDLGSFNPPAAPPAIGYRLSREYGVSFPPSGTGTALGSLWYESLGTPDPLDLFHQPDPEDFEANAVILGAYAVQAGAKVVSRLGEIYEARKAQVLQLGEAAAAGLIYVGREWVYEPLDATGRAVLQGYETGIDILGEAGGSLIYYSGNVISETVEKTGDFWDATTDAATRVADSLDPDYAITGPVMAPMFRFRLKTQSAPPSPSVLAGSAAASGANQPAYAWLTVNVPANAGFLAFDFTVTGDPRDDRIVCAINEQNVFSLAAKFAPAGVPSSTDLIDVSAYAGQTIELFFGLAGGTSSDCEVAIDGIRFITIPNPKVAVAMDGSNVAVKWPAAATGWTLESSETLASGSWQPVPLTGVSVDRGVATVAQPLAGARKFYRLRRNP